MTDEECARRVSAIQAEARQRVPEWEPWMTDKVGYGGVGVAWRRKLAAQARKEKRLEDPVKLKRYLRDRNRYLRRIGRPEESREP